MLGGCAHRHVLDYLNPDQSPPAPSGFQESIFARGEKAEKWVKLQLEKRGWSIRGGETDFTKQVNVSMFAPVNLTGFGERDRLCISASLDGVITHPNGTVRRLEVKALGKTGFTDCVEANTINAIDQYAVQTSAAAWGCDWKQGEKGEMRPTPHPIQIVIVRQGEYEDEAGNINRDGVFFEVLEAPQYTPDQLFQRCRDILVLCRDQIVPACDARYPCAWSNWEKEQATVTVDDPDLVAKLQDYDAALADQAFLEASIAAMREEVRTLVRSKLSEDTGCVLVDTWRITLTKNGRMNVKSLL